MILAIDPGYDKCGYAIIENTSRPTYVVSGIIGSGKEKQAHIRLHTLYSGLEEVITRYKPSQMALEQLFFFKNKKTVLKVSQAYGILLLLAAQHQLPVIELTPLQIKTAITGDGRADKKSVHKMLKLEMGGELPVQDDDESDAIACGIAACYTKRF